MPPVDAKGSAPEAVPRADNFCVLEPFLSKMADRLGDLRRSPASGLGFNFTALAAVDRNPRERPDNANGRYDMRGFFKLLGGLLSVLLLLAVGLVGYLSFTEYKPEDRALAPESLDTGAPALAAGQQVTLLTWNTGYAGLGADADFFMDGGDMVRPPSQKSVEENMADIQDRLQQTQADVFLLQEVDRDSARTGGVDQLAAYAQATGMSWAYGVNYRCNFVPYPLRPIGRVESGVATLSHVRMAENSIRVSLPNPFFWPVRTANLKRCLLLSRFPVEGSQRELVVVNLHLEAYDDGAGKAAQTQALLSVLEEEYEKGNYVIAGGDFNQTFPGGLGAYPVDKADLWTPGTLEESALPEGWRFAYDTALPSCRLLNQPYDPASRDTQYYVIDGFLVSPNVTVSSVETLDLGFAHSDHNPVRLVVELGA